MLVHQPKRRPQMERQRKQQQMEKRQRKQQQMLERRPTLAPGAHSRYQMPFWPSCSPRFRP